MCARVGLRQRIIRCCVDGTRAARGCALVFTCVEHTHEHTINAALLNTKIVTESGLNVGAFLLSCSESFLDLNICVPDLQQLDPFSTLIPVHGNIMRDIFGRDLICSLCNVSNVQNMHICLLLNKHAIQVNNTNDYQNSESMASEPRVQNPYVMRFKPHIR